MSVQIAAFNVVVKRNTVQEKYPGGVEQYALDCPNWTYCHDNHLSRIGFMALDDAEGFAYKLQQIHGIEPSEIAIVDQFEGLLAPRDWLEYAQHQDGLAHCWLKGTDPGNLVVPEGWDPDWARSIIPHRTSPENQVEGLELLGHEGGMDMYRDTATGDMRYVGRVRPGIGFEEVQRRYEHLYRQGCNLVEPFLQFIDRPPKQISPTDKEDIVRGIDHLLEALEIMPNSWRAMWVIGKAHQALEDNENALHWFEEACRFDHCHTEVFREAFVQCVKLDLREEAERYALSALELEPNDAGLLSNYALGLLLNGKPAQAKAAAEKAYATDPIHPVNLRVMKLIDLVLGGGTRMPWPSLKS